MQPMRQLSEDQVPSLSIIEAALEHEDASYRDRADGMETKAGLILSAAGVVVALVGTTANITAIVGQALAIASGAVAAWVLLPRVDKVIGPRDLRDQYLAAAAVYTRLVVLNTRIHLHDERGSLDGQGTPAAIGLRAAARIRCHHPGERDSQDCRMTGGSCDDRSEL